MAYTSSHAPSFWAAPSRGLAIVTDFLASVGRAMMINSTGHARLEKVQRLQAMSDEGLARMGLARHEIVRHVFHDLY